MKGQELWSKVNAKAHNICLERHLQNSLHLHVFIPVTDTGLMAVAGASLQLLCGVLHGRFRAGLPFEIIYCCFVSPSIFKSKFNSWCGFIYRLFRVYLYVIQSKM